jgi:hypothetical protein
MARCTAARRPCPVASSARKLASRARIDRIGCWCKCRMRSTRASVAWWSRPRPVRVASMVRSRSPAHGACRRAARLRTPTRARAPITSTTVRTASRSSTRIRRTTPRPTGAGT